MADLAVVRGGRPGRRLGDRPGRGACGGPPPRDGAVPARGGCGSTRSVTTRTRRQVVGAQAFRGGEGAWYADGSCWFTTKGDGRVWRYDAEHGQLRTVYDAAVSGGSLSGADNVTGFGVGELFVVQDGGDLQVCVLSPHGQVSPFLQLVGHDASEVTGPTLSQDGRRLYDSSQRDTTGRSSGGMTFQVSGPFRRGASSMPGLRDRR